MAMGSPQEPGPFRFENDCIGPEIKGRQPNMHTGVYVRVFVAVIQLVDVRNCFRRLDPFAGLVEHIEKGGLAEDK